MKCRALALLTVLALVGSVAGASAQSTAEIYGKVTDASGAVMPGVPVVLSGSVLLQPLTAVTTASGTYQFPRLAIGVYNVKFELVGFKTVLGKDLTGFSFQPPNCVDTRCTGIVALVVGFNTNPNGPIPEGSMLYTCKVTIAAQATRGAKPLSCVSTMGNSDSFYTDPSKNDLPADCTDGEIIVGP